MEHLPPPCSPGLPDPDTLDDEALGRLIFEETRKKVGFDPHPWQVRIAVAVVRRRDALCWAGTGFGKTLSFVMALFVKPKMVVWMISPLNYIEEEQARTFRKWGISAVAVNSTTKFDSVKENILAGQYQVVISSPENFCGSNKLRPIVVSDELQSWFHATVIDEAHCVHTWGKQFRVAYDRCGDMRGYMPPESPFLAATATCTEEIEKKLRARLFIREHPHVENLGNFRENIEYGVYVMSGGLKSYEEVRKFIPTRGVLRRTIIFVDSIQDAYHIMDVLREHLGLKDEDMELVQPYHALRAEQGKLDTAREFAGEECYYLVATEALTMGANFSDVGQILLFGAPENATVLVQRCGRAGRDQSMRARAITMVTPDQLAKAKKICEKLALRAPGPEETAEATIKPEGEEPDRQDPFGDAIPEEIEVPSESDGESDEEDAEPAQNRAQAQSTAAGFRPRPSKARKTKPKANLGRSRALDVDIARFIATDSCRTRILDEIFRNQTHKACELVGGCDNCVKNRIKMEDNEPDLRAGDRAAKRREPEIIDLRFHLEDPEELSQLPRKSKPKNRTGAELEKMKGGLMEWRKKVWELERKSQDLELEDIMTDNALAAIARARAVDSVDSLNNLDPLWPSRERWGQAVIDVVQAQLQAFESGSHSATSVQQRKVVTKTRTKGQTTPGAKRKAPNTEDAMVIDQTQEVADGVEPMELVPAGDTYAEATTQAGQQGPQAEGQTQEVKNVKTAERGRARGRGQGRVRGRGQGPGKRKTADSQIPAHFLGQFSKNSLEDATYLSTPGAGPSRASGDQKTSYYRSQKTETTQELLDPQHHVFSFPTQPSSNQESEPMDDSEPKPFDEGAGDGDGGKD